MTPDKRMGWGNRPVARFGVQVGMADTSVGDFDQTFARPELRGLLDRVLLVNRELSAGSFDNSGNLGFGDGEVRESRHVCFGCMDNTRCGCGYRWMVKKRGRKTCGDGSYMR